MGDFGSNVPAWFTALMTQNGQVAWDYDSADPQSIGVDLNDSGSKEVADYWQDLISKKLVDTQDQFTTDYVGGLANGSYATYVSAAWAPGYLTGAGGAATGDGAEWQVAPLPQWDPSNPVSVNWGGSTFAVTTQAKDPDLAATVAKTLYASDEELKDGVDTQTIFPLNQKVLTSDAFATTPVAFFNGQTGQRRGLHPGGERLRGLHLQPVHHVLLLRADQVDALHHRRQQDRLGGTRRAAEHDDRLRQGTGLHGQVAAATLPGSWSHAAP